MDNFVSPSHPTSDGKKDLFCNPKQVMGYFDGNTVTALWNYAQNYAMSDNYYGSTFGSFNTWPYKYNIWTDTWCNTS